MTKFNENKLLKKIWDEKRNIQAGINLQSIKRRSRVTVFLLCDTCGVPICKPKRLSYVASSICLGRNIRCDDCSGKAVPFENTLMAKVPHLLAQYWDYDKNSNDNLLPDKISAYSNRGCHVKCEKHHYEGETRIADLANGHNPCPYCNGKKATHEYNLLVCFPHYAAELNPSLSGKVAQDILPFSSEKATFDCPICGEPYEMRVSSRTKLGQGCPHCNRKDSKIEAILHLVVKIGLNDDEGLTRRKWMVFPNYRCEVDSFHKYYKFGFEYDGAYYHKRSRQIERDERKNKLFDESDELGILIRIREEGCPPLVERRKVVFIPTLRKISSSRELTESIYILFDVLRKKIPIYHLPFFSRDDIKSMIEVATEKYRKSLKDRKVEKSIAETSPKLFHIVSKEDHHLLYALTVESHECIRLECPGCGHVEPVMARNLIKRVRCNSCLLLFKNYDGTDGSKIRWERNPKSDKS